MIIFKSYVFLSLPGEISHFMLCTEYHYLFANLSYISLKKNLKILKKNCKVVKFKIFRQEFERTKSSFVVELGCGGR